MSPETSKKANKFLSQTVIQSYVNKMTNWQRTLWARNKRPKDEESLIKFTSITKEDRQGA